MNAFKMNRILVFNLLVLLLIAFNNRKAAQKLVVSDPLTSPDVVSQKPRFSHPQWARVFKFKNQ